MSAAKLEVFDILDGLEAAMSQPRWATWFTADNEEVLVTDINAHPGREDTIVVSFANGQSARLTVTIP